MSLVIEEIILTCLVLTGSVQISDNVTLVCVPPTEEVVEVEHEPEPGEGQSSEWDYHGFPPKPTEDVPIDR